MSDTDEPPQCPHCDAKIHGQWVPHGEEYYHVDCWDKERPDKNRDNWPTH